MAIKRNNSQSDPNAIRRDDSQQTVLERVDELTWALLDGEISDDEMSLLDTLLLTGDDARRRYIECVQLHTDLMAHYVAPADQTVPSGDGKTPVLGFLNVGMPAIGLQSQQPEDLYS